MLLEFIAKHQLNAMLVLSGICAVLAIFVLFIKTMSTHRKAILIIMDISAGLLLVFDRYAYIFRGDVSELGFVMVRVSNFLVFFLTLLCILMFNEFLADLYSKDVKLGKAPIPLRIVKIITIIGMLLLAVSQFTGLYYTFDELNQYQRNPSTFWICYLIPLLSLIIQFSVTIAYRKRVKRSVMLFLAFFTLVPLAASLIQFATRGVSFTNIALSTVVILLFLFTLIDVSNDAVKANDMEIEYLKKEQKDIQVLLEQTTEALATAIDVKDPYTHGHSTRVAEYSRKIAEQAGKSEEECDEIYLAAILHDVGKILVPTDIINKDGKLTKEEFEAIKMHPVHGNKILSRISKSPYLSIGAHYHHERYDGRGYPDGLKGEDIPEIARIIAVADAYDAMTSKRSYRDPIPQDKVREEFVKGIGTQFDPKFAKLMIHLIDLDAEYEMKEREEKTALSAKSKFECKEFGENISEGIQLTANLTKLGFRSVTDKNHLKKECIPSIIVFDALDGRVHEDEKVKEMLYFEYGKIRFDGETEVLGARKIEKKVIPHPGEKKNEKSLLDPAGIDYVLEAVKVKDHVLFRIKNKFETIEIIMALPDSVRYAYIGLTGEHCVMTNIFMEKAEEPVDDNYIPRIAEEISFIKDEPVGDVPNVQINGWCYDASHGLDITDGMKMSFHAKSLPTARLIWHCPYIELFYADDKLVNGENFHQFALIRLDGEAWDTHDGVESKTFINRDETFEGWDVWKENNRKGIDVTVTFKRNKNKITVITENFGISINSIVTIIDDVPDVYVALTGDQVAISNIRVVE